MKGLWRMRARRSFTAIAMLSLSACDTAGDSAVRLDTTVVDDTVTQPMTTPVVTTIDGAGGASGAPDDFYCGSFGQEWAPTLVAIELSTGEPRWTYCSASTIPVYVYARATGATLLMEQDGRGGSTIVAIDDTGVERWRRPILPTTTSLWAAGSSVVTLSDEVEAIDSVTGDVRWQHPVADGTPVGATGGMVIEAAGGPFALSTDLSASTDMSMRALDATTGETQWERTISLPDVSFATQYTPAIADGAIVLPGTNGRTEIVAASTGDTVLELAGTVYPMGPVLIENDPTTMMPISFIDPTSGARVEAAGRMPPYFLGSAETLTAEAGWVVASEPATGPAATLSIIEPATGAVRWEVDYAQPIGRTADHVVVVEGPTLRVLDAADGAVTLEYTAPSDLATFRSAAVTDDLVIVSSEWTGSGGTGAPPSTDPPAAPDCAGGPTLLETQSDNGPVVVSESVDGRWFCIDTGQSDFVAAAGATPAVPTASPRFDAMGMLDELAWYTFALPSGFPSSAALDEDGNEYVVARGSAADYLVVLQFGIDPMGGPQMRPRTLGLAGADGVVLATVRFDGYITDEVATFEDFVACAVEHGVEPPDLTRSGPIVAANPSAPEALVEAWASCRDLWTSDLRWNQGMSQEEIDKLMAFEDCVALAGFYPMLFQPIEDSQRYEEVSRSCQT